MAQSIVGGLDDALKEQLQRRAAQHGQSMEVEAREILRDALTVDDRPVGGLGSRIASRFKGIGLKSHETIAEFRGAQP